MPIPVYYAVTTQELQSLQHYPEYLALIDFYNGTKDAIVILTDRRPWHLQQVREIVREQPKILLDFQHPDDPENHKLIAELERLRLPYCATSIYAGKYDCAVLVPPVPLTSTLADHIAPWKGREIWLELALDGQRMTVTKDGCTERYVPHAQQRQACHTDEKLHCHYCIHTTENAAEFTLWRSKEDIAALLTEADSLGIRLAVGLWQELK